MTGFRKTWFPICLWLLATGVDAEPRRRALLVGINDYGARNDAAKAAPVIRRSFPNLRGAVRDVALMEGLVTSVYQFSRDEIVTLTDRAATRHGILTAIDRHLVAGAQRGDILLFYFSGHGSQVRNSLSEEADGLDESIVPADVHRGALDIRDKELLRHFAPLVERGVQLTVILDSCHSGSGVRGLPGGGTARVAPRDMRDVKDPYRGPSLEERGALVLSAARDTDLAFEIRTNEKQLQGAFTWAWARAVRDAPVGEAAIETFHRAAARMTLERPDQVPVLAGNAEARFAPFLGMRQDRDAGRVVVGVRTIDANGFVQIRGGWANGLTVGSELRPVAIPPSDTRLEVTALDGLSGCTARIRSGDHRSIHSGSLLELVAWAPPRDKPLRIWMPQGGPHVMAFAHALANEARRAGIDWLRDPTADREMKRILRWNGEAWESFDASREQTSLSNVRDAREAFACAPAGLPVFVQLPASPGLVQRIGAQPSIEHVRDHRDADYILTGRLVDGRVQYAWVRPAVDRRDERQSRLPLRTDWHDAENGAAIAAALTEDLRRLQRIHLWQTVPTPPDAEFSYRLAIRRARDNALLTDATMVEGERYGFVLRAGPGVAEGIKPRFVYVFMVDSYGRSVLFFPRSATGSVENRFPFPDTAPEEIRLGSRSAVIPEAPFGTDTYFLLATEEPLTDPWILEWAGVRTTADERGRTPFERLLLRLLSGDRGVTLPQPASPWSIERVAVTSLPSPARGEGPQ